MKCPASPDPYSRRDSEAALVRRPADPGLLAPLFLPLLSLIVYQHNVLLVFWLIHDGASNFAKWRNHDGPSCLTPPCCRRGSALDIRAIFKRNRKDRSSGVCPFDPFCVGSDDPLVCLLSLRLSSQQRRLGLRHQYA